MGTVNNFNRFTLPDNLVHDYLINISTDADAISFGDLMYESAADIARPADIVTDQGSLAANQLYFAQRFVGVSQAQVLTTETNSLKRIPIRTEGVMEFACSSATFRKGDLVGIDENDAGNALLPYRVIAVTDPRYAIGVVVKNYSSATTTVRVYVRARRTTHGALEQGLVGWTPLSGNVAGQALYYQGGAGSGSAAGGAATVAGGQGGATGAGGAVSLLAGAGGSTSGAGGAITITAGAGAGTSAGGAVTLTAGASGAGATGNGGAASLVGGAASSTNGNGGDVVLQPGALSGTGATGMVRIAGTAPQPFALNMVRSTIANGGTITDAQTAGQALYQDASGGNVTMTTRTGTQLAAYFAGMATGNAVQIHVASNHATNTSTISGGTDVTLVGSGAVTQTGGTFLLIKTAATTFDLVRVG